jgi:hypothetical protein
MVDQNPSTKLFITFYTLLNETWGNKILLYTINLFVHGIESQVQNRHKSPTTPQQRSYWRQEQ